MASDPLHVMMEIELDLLSVNIPMESLFITWIFPVIITAAAPGRMEPAKFMVSRRRRR